MGDPPTPTVDPHTQAHLSCAAPRSARLPRQERHISSSTGEGSSRALGRSVIRCVRPGQHTPAQPPSRFPSHDLSAQTSSLPRRLSHLEQQILRSGPDTSPEPHTPPHHSPALGDASSDVQEACIARFSDNRRPTLWHKLSLPISRSASADRAVISKGDTLLLRGVRTRASTGIEHIFP